MTRISKSKKVPFRQQVQSANGLPFTWLNAAMTADGKLAPASRVFKPFGGKRDLALLLELRARADAVMCGARTVDLFPATLGPGGSKYRKARLRNGLAECNLRVVVSGSASLNPKSEIFRHRFSAILVITSEAAPQRRVEALRKVATEVRRFGKRDVDLKAALRWLKRKWGVQRLVCEGGGELNQAMLRARLVDEVYLTLCPLIFGGRNAPTLADGIGVSTIDKAVPLELKSRKRIGDELFLVYSTRPSKKRGG